MRGGALVVDFYSSRIEVACVMPRLKGTFPQSLFDTKIEGRHFSPYYYPLLGFPCLLPM